MPNDDLWRETADLLPPDIVADIVAAMNREPARVRAVRAVREWVSRPRGTAAVIAAMGADMERTVRLMRGE